MNRICRYAFPGAKRVIDRFHVQKQVLEAVQEVRIAHRWDAINADTEAREQVNLTGEKYEPARLANGDTLKELLAVDAMPCSNPQKSGLTPRGSAST